MWIYLRTYMSLKKAAPIYHYCPKPHEKVQLCRGFQSCCRREVHRFSSIKASPHIAKTKSYLCFSAVWTDNMQKAYWILQRHRFNWAQKNNTFRRPQKKRLLVSCAQISLLTSCVHIPLTYQALDRLFTFAVVHVANVDFLFCCLRI